MTSGEDLAAGDALSTRSAGSASTHGAAREGVFARFGITAFDVIAVVTLTALAALLRLWDLGAVPLGLHGDEAWTGLDARRILDEGWIGVYVDSALGQPTGPLYFTALLFALLPDTTFTIRLSMALFGVATIPLAYAAFSLMFNRTVAVFGTFILATMMWHLHLGRTGFMVTAWPFFEVGVLLALWLAFKHRENPWLFVLAGALTGLGVYSYNAYLLFVPVAFVPVAYMILEQRDAERRTRAIYMGVLFALTALLFALPLLRYIDENPTFYQRHQRVVGLTHQEEWDDAGVVGKADLIWDRAREWHNGLIYGNRPDQGDGLAEFGFPPVEPIIYFFALIGIGFALWNVRRKEYGVLIAAAVMLPWGALLTVEDGLFRRTFGLAPFVAVLAALPLAWLWDALWVRRSAFAMAGLAVVALIPSYAAARTIHDYFGPVQDTFTVGIVYPYELDAAARWMDDLPDDTRVYFYSDRWSINYETVRFLAPDVAGEDRSFEFRSDLTLEQDAPLQFNIDHDGPVAFVLLGDYLSAVDAVMRAHPGGQAFETKRGDELLFVAYVVEP